MKTLLVALNAKYIHSNLAVYNLKAYAKPFEESIQIIEYTINHHVQDMLKGIYKERADIIAFSCYIWNIELIGPLVELLHQVSPGTKIWLGGPEVSYDAQAVMERRPELTGIMHGEGEATFYQLMAYYHQAFKAVPISEIKGITYRDAKGQLITNPKRPLINLDSIPFAYHNLDYFQHKIRYYESSRGCPFSCSYCLSSIDRTVRFRDLKLVKQELKFFIDHEVHQVKFTDRTFNCDHGRTLEIWQFIKEQDQGKTNFHFEVAADLFNEEELLLLESLRPGLIQLEIGVQSTNLKTLTEIKRQTILNRLAENVLRIHHQQNINQHLDLIAGLPYEDLESFKSSFNWVYHLHPEQLQLGFLKVLKGSMMHQKQAEYGLLSWSKPVYEVLSTKWISYDCLLILKAVEAMVEIYYNTGQFKNTLSYLNHFFSTPFDLYQALSVFYEEKGYNSLKHARISRYTILLEFSNESGLNKEHILEEIMLYDLYLREKLKSRPDWAPDQTKFKQAISAYYRNLEQEATKQIRYLTHIEPFMIDIKQTVSTGEAIKQPSFILFDYRKRDPLHHEGRTIRLKGDENGIK